MLGFLATQDLVIPLRQSVCLGNLWVLDDTFIRKFTDYQASAMNYGALLPSPHQTPPLSSLAIEKLQQSVRQQLPLQFRVASSGLEKKFVVYNCVLSNVATGNSWSVSYRYSEFAAFSKKVETQCSCFDARCCGSCEAIREFLWVCFPSKRLSSRSTRTIADRKRKFETVVQYLLRCVLLPGSAMKCLVARQNLPTVLFDFLGVRNEADKRSVLQVFVDNYQSPSRCNKSECRDSFNSDTSTTDSIEALQCMFCLEEVEVEPPSSSIVLPCQHTFHRECIFEWLLFQFHCPMCRARIGPPASASYCIEKNTIFQWWLCNFEEDPLRVVKEA